MDFSMVAAGGSIGEQETLKPKKKGRNSIRYSPEQIARLEQMFKECSHPDYYQQRQLGEELGLEPRKVKFWFQNKRTQVKTQTKRSNNNDLCFENEKIQSENMILRDTLKNVICASCRGLNSEEEVCAPTMQNLRLENAFFRQEHERLSKLVRKNIGINPVLPSTLQSSCDPSQQSLLNQNSEITAPNQHIPAPNPRMLAIGQHIPTHTLMLRQHITDHTPTPALHEDIPTLTPALDQNFFVMTPAPDQNYPSLTRGTAISLDQNISSVTPAHDQNIPALTYPHDHDILALISSIDQDIPILDQNISGLTSALDQDTPVLSPALDQLIPTLDQDILAHDLFFGASLGVLDGCMLPHPDMKRVLIMEIANNAMEELTRLLSMNEPFWFRSVVDGKFILQRETYEKMYLKSNYLKGPHARIESSKDSRIVNMSGIQLVDMFLNSDNWVNLFPTIVKNAQTMQVFERGSSESRNGSLQLMNAKVHILSPLVPIRQFIFLRYCKQIEVGVWVIADVSLDSSLYDATPPCTWRFPSGCMIHEITNGSCRVSWVEHVEVDDKIQTDPLYREVICINNAYGAERWVSTLERMCERFASASLESVPSSDAGGVISSVEGRRSLMKLAQRMVKMFCGSLDMTDSIDFPPLNKLNNGGVRVSVRKSIYPGVLDGMIVSAATSFWLPLSPQNVFDFLKDNSKRLQWDVLCHAKPVHEIQRIINGTNHGNFTSIIRPFIPRENNMLILQESYTNHLESLLVFALIDISTLNFIMKGEDSSLLPLLPSGFTISGDGRTNACVEQSKGSLVTLAYEVPASTPSVVDKLDMSFVTLVNTLVTTTVENIKVAFNCSNLD